MDFLDVLIGISNLLTWAGLWVMICSRRTFHKRMALLDRISTIPSNHLLAYEELNLVEFKEHKKALMRMQNTKKLYGPLLQDIWDRPHPHGMVYSEFWWKCYNEIYLNLLPEGRQPETQPDVRLHMSRGWTLPDALIQSGIEIYEWLGLDHVAP